jgi:hypothetical protein
MGVSKQTRGVFIDIHQESLVTINDILEAFSVEEAVLYETRKKIGTSDCETKTQDEFFELIIGFNMKLKGINLCFEFPTCQLKR